MTAHSADAGHGQGVAGSNPAVPMRVDSIVKAAEHLMLRGLHAVLD
jgi:hypothetical protein